MTEFTPSNENLRDAWREVRPGRSWDEARDEFDRWLAAHDQGIRDAVKRPDLTAKEHLEAAFDKAHPVPKGRDVPVGVPLIAHHVNGDIWVYATGFISWNAAPTDRVEVRTLEPLPPLIPDDCKEVRASSDEDPLRSVWIRDARAVDAWVTVTVLGEVMRAHTNDLIDPKPVPEEES